MTTFQFAFLVSLLSFYFYGLINDLMRNWKPAPSPISRRLAVISVVFLALGFSWGVATLVTVFD